MFFQDVRNAFELRIWDALYRLDLVTEPLSRSLGFYRCLSRPCHQSYAEAALIDFLFPRDLALVVMEYLDLKRSSLAHFAHPTLQRMLKDFVWKRSRTKKRKRQQNTLSTEPFFTILTHINVGFASSHIPRWTSAHFQYASCLSISELYIELERLKIFDPNTASVPAHRIPTFQSLLRMLWPWLKCTCQSKEALAQWCKC